MRICKIDVTKIDKERLFKGAKGTYLDVVLFENKEPDEYGNDGTCVQSVSKEEREKGVKGKIIGNWKRVGEKKKESAPKPAAAAPAAGEPDDLPF